jgi:hypothetical protein
MSDDGKRTFMKTEWGDDKGYIYYCMTTGSYGENLWPTQVPRIESVEYPNNLYGMLENDEWPEVKVTVYDPQGPIPSTNDWHFGADTLFPDGFIAGGRSEEAPLYIYGWGGSKSDFNIFYRYIARGSAWPNRTPIMTGRYYVVDDEQNFSYLDTPIISRTVITPTILYPLLLN